MQEIGRTDPFYPPSLVQLPFMRDFARQKIHRSNISKIQKRAKRALPSLSQYKKERTRPENASHPHDRNQGGEFFDRSRDLLSNKGINSPLFPGGGAKKWGRQSCVDAKSCRHF